MADCIHQLDLCPACDGLRVVQLDRIEGISSVTLDAPGVSSISVRGPVRVWGGPVPGPCPNTASEETNRVRRA